MTDLEQLKKLVNEGAEPHIWVSVMDNGRCIVRLFPNEPKGGGDSKDSVYIHVDKDRITKI